MSDGCQELGAKPNITGAKRPKVGQLGRRKYVVLKRHGEQYKRGLINAERVVEDAAISERWAELNRGLFLWTAMERAASVWRTKKNGPGGPFLDFGFIRHGKP